jgi:hypothetical protein
MAGLNLMNPCRIPVSGQMDPLFAGLRVVRQCPLAGTRVPRGTAVSFQARTRLPGGFFFTVQSDEQAIRCLREQGYVTRSRP